MQDRRSSETAMRLLLAVARGGHRAGRAFPGFETDRSSNRVAEILAEAARIVGSEASAEDRVVAIRLLVLGDSRSAAVRLPELLDARQPAPIQLAALQALAEILDRTIAERIVARWKSMSPVVRREAIEVLVSRREAIETLLNAFSNRAITSAEVDSGRLTQLRSHPDPAIRERAQQALASATNSSSGRAEVVRTYRPSLQLAGNPDRGRVTFMRVCATCHRADGQGIDVGPNLATVAVRSPEDLLVHVLDPNREVAPNYLNYNVALQSGRLVSGMLADETASSLTLRRAEGAFDVLPRDQVESIASTGVSLMPEGLEQGLSHQDLANLITFIRSIAPPNPSRPGPAAR
jgi:putative heme-binding domain-containing protein